MWNRGAKRNPIPISVIARRSRSIGIWISRPSASITSALPQRLLAERFPCFAIFMPAPAATKAAAVEILNVPDPSPPVPQVSRTAGTSPFHNGSAFSLITRANPMSSVEVSPFILSAVRNPATCASVACPLMISSMTARASGSVRSVRSTSFWMISVIIVLGLKKILQEVFSNDGHYRFRMKLNSFSGEVTMPETHDDSVLGFCTDRQARRNLGHHEGVIPRGGESLRQTAEESLAVVKNLAGLAVHQRGSPHNFSSKNFPDCLVSQTYAEHW